MAKIMTIPLIVGISDRFVPIVPPGSQIDSIYATPGAMTAANGQLFLFGYDKDTPIFGRDPADETNEHIVARAVAYFTNTISVGGGFAYKVDDAGGWNKSEGIRYVVAGSIYPLLTNGKLIVRFR